MSGTGVNDITIIGTCLAILILCSVMVPFVNGAFDSSLPTLVDTSGLNNIQSGSGVCPSGTGGELCLPICSSGQLYSLNMSCYHNYALNTWYDDHAQVWHVLSNILFGVLFTPFTGWFVYPFWVNLILSFIWLILVITVVRNIWIGGGG